MPTFFKPRLRKLLRIQAWLLLAGLSYASWIEATGFYIPCFFRTVTGFLCPGCGISHMCMALLHGDLKTAWEANPVILALLPWLLFLAARTLVFYIKYEKAPAAACDTVIPAVLAAMTLLWGIFRNIC